MNDDQYLAFEKVAQPAMRELMEAVRAKLAELGIACSPVWDYDLDEERGLALDITHFNLETSIGLQLMLTDGDVHGFEDGDEGFDGDGEAISRKPACGLMLELIGPGGLVGGSWSQHNYSPNVGTGNPQEIVNRVRAFDAGELAGSVIGRCEAMAQHLKSQAGDRPRG